MRKLLLVFIAFLSLTTSHAQQDFLVLRKHHEDIKTFFTGSDILFESTSQQWINANIKKITNDTLYLKPFELVHYINSLGLPSMDTLWHNLLIMPVSDIYALPRNDRSFEYIKNGTIFQIGGGGYILLNVINNLSNGSDLFSDNNGLRLGIAAGVLVIGTIMHIAHTPNLVLGKKYKLVYVKLNAPSS